jgi:hypothetical protein
VPIATESSLLTGTNELPVSSTLKFQEPDERKVFILPGWNENKKCFSRGSPAMIYKNGSHLFCLCRTCNLNSNLRIPAKFCLAFQLILKNEMHYSETTCPEYEMVVSIYSGIKDGLKFSVWDFDETRPFIVSMLFSVEESRIEVRCESDLCNSFAILKLDGESFNIVRGKKSRNCKHMSLLIASKSFDDWKSEFSKEVRDYKESVPPASVAGGIVQNNWGDGIWRFESLSLKVQDQMKAAYAKTNENIPLGVNFGPPLRRPTENFGNKETFIQARKNSQALQEIADMVRHRRTGLYGTQYKLITVEHIKKSSPSLENFVTAPKPPLCAICGRSGDNLYLEILTSILYTFVNSFKIEFLVWYCSCNISKIPCSLPAGVHFYSSRICFLNEIFYDFLSVSAAYGLNFQAYCKTMSIKYALTNFSESSTNDFVTRDTLSKALCTFVSTTGMHNEISNEWVQERMIESCPCARNHSYTAVAFDACTGISISNGRMPAKHYSSKFEGKEKPRGTCLSDRATVQLPTLPEGATAASMVQKVRIFKEHIAHFAVVLSDALVLRKNEDISYFRDILTGFKTMEIQNSWYNLVIILVDKTYNWPERFHTSIIRFLMMLCSNTAVVQILATHVVDALNKIVTSNDITRESCLRCLDAGLNTVNGVLWDSLAAFTTELSDAQKVVVKLPFIHVLKVILYLTPNYSISPIISKNINMPYWYDKFYLKKNLPRIC